MNVIRAADIGCVVVRADPGGITVERADAEVAVSLELIGKVLDGEVWNDETSTGMRVGQDVLTLVATNGTWQYRLGDLIPFLPARHAVLIRRPADPGETP